MLSRDSLRIVVFIILILLHPVSVLASQTFVFQLPLYLSAPACAQQCVLTGSVSGVNKYDCGNGSPQTCLCSANEGQSSFVSSYAFTCASTKCGGSTANRAGASAAALWSAYCVANSALPPTAGATAGSGGTATPASGNTLPQQTGGTGGGIGSYQRPRLVQLALAMGIGIGMPALIAGL